MIPVSEPDLGQLEREYLMEAFDSGWISSRGKFIESAEAGLRRVTGAANAAVCSNGTTALHLALLASGIKTGDEVILPSLTYISTLNAVYYVGATPVIVDVLESSWCIDPQAVEAAITHKSRAILAVDLYGMPADYNALRVIARKHGLILIADAAESIGASLHGVEVGSLADISTFSFFGNKVVTSGEGGAVTTDDAATHSRILQLRNQGNHPTTRYYHDMVGYNYRMTNLAAAILTAQLERVDYIVQRRRDVIRQYQGELALDVSFVGQNVAQGVVATPWMYSVRLLGRTPDERDAVMQSLARSGIESRPVFRLVQDMPFVPAEQRQHTPIAATISREGISLPTYPGLQSAQIKDVTSALRQALSALEERS